MSQIDPWVFQKRIFFRLLTKETLKSPKNLSFSCVLCVCFVTWLWVYFNQPYPFGFWFWKFFSSVSASHQESFHSSIMSSTIIPFRHNYKKIHWIFNCHLTRWNNFTFSLTRTFFDPFYRIKWNIKWKSRFFHLWVELLVESFFLSKFPLSFSDFYFSLFTEKKIYAVCENREKRI